MLGLFLKFLAKWHPKEAISLKTAFLKDSCPSIPYFFWKSSVNSCFCADYAKFSDEGSVFIIPSHLKHTRSSPPSKIVCVKWDTPELNVEEYVLFYMQKTLKYRLKSWNKNKEKSKQLSFPLYWSPSTKSFNFQMNPWSHASVKHRYFFFCSSF